MRPVVIWGAGKIGRGFVADVFASQEHRIVMVDVDRALIEKMREAGRYTIFGADADGLYETVIEGYEALHTSQVEAIGEVLIQAQPIVVVCVFAHQVADVARMLAPFLKQRAQEMPNEPIDIVMAVNMLHPEKAMKAALEGVLEGDTGAREYLEKRVGIACSVFMCIAPDAPEAYLKKDALAVYNNHYHEQVVDALAFRGKKPEGLKKLRLSEQIEAEETRKIYTLNMAHAATSYLADGRGLNYMIEAVRDERIRPMIERALEEAAVGLSGEFGFGMEQMGAWNRRIVGLLENPYINDDLVRLGADTKRKLGGNDRLVGTARLCIKHGGEPVVLAEAIRKGFEHEGPDVGTQYVRGVARERGIEEAVRMVSGIDKNERLYEMIVEGEV